MIMRHHASYTIQYRSARYTLMLLFPARDREIQRERQRDRENYNDYETLHTVYSTGQLDIFYCCFFQRETQRQRERERDTERVREIQRE